MKKLKTKILSVIALCIVSLVGIILCQTMWMKGTGLVSSQHDSEAIDVLNSVSQEYIRLERLNDLERKDSTERILKCKEVNRVLLDSLFAFYMKDSKHSLSYRYDLAYSLSSDSVHVASKGFEDCHSVSLLGQLQGNHGADELGDYRLYLCFSSGKILHIPEKLWFSLIGLGLFIAILVFCLVYLIKTVMRQKRLAEEQSDFINGMIHELKTPVATIGMSSKVLKKAGTSVTDFEKLRNYAEIVEAENNRIWVCVDSLLQTLTVTKRVLNLNIEPVDVNSTIKLAIEGFSVATMAKVTFELKLDDDIPLINADKMHVRAIVDNIVDNAIKYSPANSRITVITKRMWEHVLVMVEDSGRGITSKDSKRMFDKFYRVSSEKKRGVKGFGLGLYYVKQVVDAHAGKIFVKSKLNKGTQIGVLLPINN